jgi:hypothetical protein
MNRVWAAAAPSVIGGPGFTRIPLDYYAELGEEMRTHRAAPAGGRDLPAAEEPMV